MPRGVLFTEVRGRDILGTSHSPGPIPRGAPDSDSLPKRYYPDFLKIPSSWVLTYSAPGPSVPGPTELRLYGVLQRVASILTRP
jgi:hypothetical protein